MFTGRARIPFMVFLSAVVFIAAAAPARSSLLNVCTQDVPCVITNLEFFLDNQCFEVDVFDADSYEPITDWNFEGVWEFTAIARESVIRNFITKAADASTPLFDTDDCSNWGRLETVNFNSENLTFTGGTKTRVLDPFCPEGSSNTNCTDFEVFRLTEDALKSLDYLEGNPIMPRKGDFIIGFNDSGSDSDFDDIIILARWVTQPAPPEPNQAIIERKTFVTPFVTFDLIYDSNGLSQGVECEKCTIVTISSIGNLRFGEKKYPGTVVDFPYDTPVSASASPDCTYVRTRSGGVQKICP